IRPGDGGRPGHLRGAAPVSGRHTVRDRERRGGGGRREVRGRAGGAGAATWRGRTVVSAGALRALVRECGRAARASAGSAGSGPVTPRALRVPGRTGRADR